MLVDLRAKKITGKEAEAMLGAAHITCNKNAIPNDPEKPFVTSRHPPRQPGHDHPRFQGSRSGKVGNLIADVLDNPHDAATIDRVKAEVEEIDRRFPGLRRLSSGMKGAPAVAVADGQALILDQPLTHCTLPVSAP